MAVGIPLRIRASRPADQPFIHHLLAFGSRPSPRTWAWEQELGQEWFLVAISGRRLVGALLALPDAGPVAWVRLGALDRSIAVAPWLDQSLPLLARPLRQMGARMLAWMDVGDWVGSALKRQGFRPLTRLVTMVNETRSLPPLESGGTSLRAGKGEDVPALVRADHAAFSPPWWLSAKMMQQMLRESPCFLVAEKEGQPVGYAEARLTESGAHIGRLVVAPQVQGQGVGALLLRGTLSRLWRMGVRLVTLNTQEENRTSQQLYIRFGFRPVGRRVTAWQRGL